MKKTDIRGHIGNLKLLNLPKTAFLCSSKYSSKAVLKSYDWAKEQCKNERCIISGFHSVLEKDVLQILLKGDQPIIYALARGMFKKVPDKLKLAVESGRMLIVTPFDKSIVWTTRENAEIRNQLCIELAENITIAHITQGGQLDRLLSLVPDKRVNILDK